MKKREKSFVTVEILRPTVRLACEGRNIPPDTNAGRLLVLLGLAPDCTLATGALRQYLGDTDFEHTRQSVVDRTSHHLHHAIEKVGKHGWRLRPWVAECDADVFCRLSGKLGPTDPDASASLVRRRLFGLFPREVTWPIADQCQLAESEAREFVDARVRHLNELRSSVLSERELDLTGPDVTGASREVMQLLQCVPSQAVVDDVARHLDKGDVATARALVHQARTARTVPASILAVLDGVLAFAERDFLLAESHFRRATEIDGDSLAARECLGVAVYYSLAYSAGSDMAKAIDDVGQTLALREQRGLLSPNTAETTANLASICLQAGDIERAESLYWRALALFHECAPDPTLGAMGVMMNIASCRAKAGDYHTASQLFERAALYYELVPHHLKDPRDMATLENNRGYVAARLGRGAAARRHFENALAIRTSLLAKDDPLVQQTQSHLERLSESDAGS